MKFRQQVLPVIMPLGRTQDLNRSSQSGEMVSIRSRKLSPGSRSDSYSDLRRACGQDQMGRFRTMRPHVNIRVSPYFSHFDERFVCKVIWGSESHCASLAKSELRFLGFHLGRFHKVALKRFLLRPITLPLTTFLMIVAVFGLHMTCRICFCDSFSSSPQKIGEF